MNAFLSPDSISMLCLLLFRISAILVIAWIVNFAIRYRYANLSIVLWRTTTLFLFASFAFVVWLPDWGPNFASNDRQSVAPMASSQNSAAHLPFDYLATETGMTSSVSDQPAAKEGRNLSGDSAAAVLPAPTPNQTAAKIPLSHQLLTISLLSYVIGVTALLWILLRDWWSVRALIRTSTLASSQTDTIGNDICHAIGSRRVPRFLLSDKVRVPMACGIFSPAVVLPAGADEQTNAKDLKQILSHECVHLSNNDIFWSLLIRLASILLWPHPLTWKIGEAHRFACDVNCDAFASTDSRESYAQLLARLALEYSSFKSESQVAMAICGHSDTVKRIQFVQQGVVRVKFPFMLGSVLTLTMLFCTVATFGSVVSQPGIQNSESAQDPETKGVEQSNSNEDEQKSDEVPEESELFPLEIVVFGEDNQPIQDATVVISSLRTKLERASAHSNGQFIEEGSAQTDSDGIASVSYPKYVYEKMETGYIVLRIRHPDFANYVDQMVEVAPGLSIEVNMKSGRKLSFTAIDEKANRQLKEHVYAITPRDNSGSKWTNLDGTLSSGSIDKEVPSMMLVATKEGQPTLFSDLIDLEKTPNKSAIKLRSGNSIKGRLADNVPRPIRNGTVALGIAFSLGARPTHDNAVRWTDHVVIEEDGSFEFPSVPRSETVHLLANCDGWVSDRLLLRSQLCDSILTSRRKTMRFECRTTW